MTTKPWAVLALSVLALAGCGDDEVEYSSGQPVGGRIAGASGELGGVEVETWAVVDAAGAVGEVGITLPLAAVEGVTEMSFVDLAFPPEAQTTTFFDHLGLGFMPQGHGPQPYAVPHFDLHFYAIAHAAQLAIDCVAEPMPAAARIPAPYVIPGTGLEPDGTCVPQMGVHAIDPTSPELAPESPAPFIETFLLGYHDGALAFLEPMMTKEFLEEAHLYGNYSLSLDVPQPAELGRTTRWPSQMDLEWNEAAAAYEVSFSGLVARDD